MISNAGAKDDKKLERIELFFEHFAPSYDVLLLQVCCYKRCGTASGQLVSLIWYKQYLRRRMPKGLPTRTTREENGTKCVTQG